MNIELSDSISKCFSENGALAQAIPGFKARQAQLDMATAVRGAIKDKAQLVVEAGTGTGKTFAYLAPALLAGKKVIVSTGTKALQEQLFHRDLPLVKKALRPMMKTALLKGRSNYLCINRLEVNGEHPPYDDPSFLSDISNVRKWSSETSDGDIGELTSIEENSRVLPFVTSTVDNCLSKDCPNIADCHVMNARKKALEADLIVVNHHLFFADLALKDTGFGELIPDTDVIIFDEAHQIPDIASEYFGEHFSSRQVFELCKDIQAEYQAQLRDMPQLNKAAMTLEKNILDMRLVFAEDPERGNWRDKSKSDDIVNAIQYVLKAFNFLYDVTKLAISRTETIDNCFERLVQLKGKFEKVNQTQENGYSYWFDTTKRHFTLHITPLSIADKFGAIVDESNSSWIFTSATVSVDDNFDHYTSLLGIPDARTQMLGSPFDYQNQAMFCVPRYFPEPNDKAAVRAFSELALELVEASRGRAFLLFTSHRVMTLVAKMIEDEIKYPVLVQGTTSKRLLLEQFTKLKHAVLLGTGSFWEGVDVRGDMLSLVMIDKLPFASPDEPLLQARIEDCKLKGLEPFQNVQIPQAVISLKQGVGRLIRDVTDKGVLVICDPRLVTRQYGEVFMRSLPNMKRTRDLDTVKTFLKGL
ncbi:ATP-dependent helicase [Psychrosphaera saromensis]|uniref:ATP-dependent DNA helicase YoaA n=1 Tax=Psychrosphaera saromensis TaxID=716813 RepID=A0A2S7UUH7_9GAMM|nr:ATP-dependent DNA helicase [Psychrosphaera saromensis]PQJ53644.1 ATP-dependent helicase [Psychrosphaera saromensis]GHB63564.1 ATP-dependent helicase [Psychrosphaera saromensis]GLQ15587.1 ATP-dependent helicase [Psychrosphaera saromensis]